MGKHKIPHERRQYNQWVANETLEDFALRFTAQKARKWSNFRVANAALGTVAFLVLEAVGAAVTLSFGFTNAVAAILVVGAVIFSLGLPVSYYAAKYGVDIDLLTRGAGFGYIGSTITSLIYASFTFIFFALEAAVMATALELCFGVPLFWGYLLSALVAIPLVTHGFTFLNRFQFWTQIVWLFLQAIPFVAIATHGLLSLQDWTTYPGRLGPVDGHFDLMLFGGAAAVVFALVPQNAEQVDFLRFLPRKRAGRHLGWWAAVVCAGPGWIVPGIIKMLAGSFLAVLLVGQGYDPANAAQPAQMYLVAFQTAIGNPEIALGLTGVFVVVSQLKINVTNAYAGSLAWSNFFSRLTHSHPGRVVWVVFNVMLAWLLMQLGIFQALERTLGLYSNIPVAWMGAIAADLVINKPLGLSPRHIEFRRAYLYDINPVGLGAMLAGSALAITVYAGGFGDAYVGLAPFVALGVSIALTPMLAWITRGRYYSARPPHHLAETQAGEIRCSVCEHSFEAQDMAQCPFYAGPICSLCCSLDVRCDDACKEFSRFADQWHGLMTRLLPNALVRAMDIRLLRYAGLVLLCSLISVTMLGLVYVQMTSGEGVNSVQIADTLHNVFYAMVIMIAIAIWPFLLASESSRTARKETNHQTAMLVKEIEAHKRTDGELQRAKEIADARNVAKSRYVRGMSHELRTPLNAILGYSQVLENDDELPRNIQQSIRVIRRSADHLSSLVDGLLDISMIEAGRLQLLQEELQLREFLQQLVDMMRLQARDAGLQFVFQAAPSLPETTRTDEKRLRQILINLLSNAIRYTDKGQVKLTVSYGGQVARFDIEDTGIGIAQKDIERIFNPFERIETPDRLVKSGSGLGLTIARHLTDALGGELTVTSTLHKGSKFSLRLFLPPIEESVTKAKMRNAVICGYHGQRRTILVVDDDANQLGFVRDALIALGFRVVTGSGGFEGLQRAIEVVPDAILLDISMPDMDGWTVAKVVRETVPQRIPIIIMSAHVPDGEVTLASAGLHDAYLMKPVRLNRLLENMRRLLHLSWIFEEKAERSDVPLNPDQIDGKIPSAPDLDSLHQLGQIGHLHGILTKLDEIGARQPDGSTALAHLRRLAEECDLAGFRETLEVLKNHVDR